MSQLYVFTLYSAFILFNISEFSGKKVITARFLYIPQFLRIAIAIIQAEL